MRETHNPFGAIGKFPRGKMHPTDEGAVRFGITHRNGKVILDFGTPVAWIGMGPDEAKQLAALLIKHAEEC